MTGDGDRLAFARSMLCHVLATRVMQRTSELALESAAEYERIALCAEANGDEWVQRRGELGAAHMLDQAVGTDAIVFAMRVLAAFGWRWFRELLEGERA